MPKKILIKVLTVISLQATWLHTELNVQESDATKA